MKNDTSKQHAPSITLRALDSFVLSHEISLVEKQEVLFIGIHFTTADSRMKSLEYFLFSTSFFEHLNESIENLFLDLRRQLPPPWTINSEIKEFHLGF